MEEALQQRTYRDAVAGKRMAMREVVKWITEREAWLAKHKPKGSRRKIRMIAPPDPDNADAALVLLGIAAPNPARTDLGLAPFAQKRRTAYSFLLSSAGTVPVVGAGSLPVELLRNSFATQSPAHSLEETYSNYRGNQFSERRTGWLATQC
jgi:hypothetical protein